MNTLAMLHVSTSATVITVTSMLVGVLTPAIIAVVNHPIWTSEQKRLISLGCSVLIGILTVIGQGAFTDFEVSIPTVITIVLAIVGASQAAYAVFWKPTGLSDAIEERVNPGPPPPVDIEERPPTYAPGGTLVSGPTTWTLPEAMRPKKKDDPPPPPPPPPSDPPTVTPTPDGPPDWIPDEPNDPNAGA